MTVQFGLNIVTLVMCIITLTMATAALMPQIKMGMVILRDGLLWALLLGIVGFVGFVGWTRLHEKRSGEKPTIDALSFVEDSSDFSQSSPRQEVPEYRPAIDSVFDDLRIESDQYQPPSRSMSERPNRDVRTGTSLDRAGADRRTSSGRYLESVDVGLSSLRGAGASRFRANRSEVWRTPRSSRLEPVFQGDRFYGNQR